MKPDYIKTHSFIMLRWKDGKKENHEGEYALPYPFVPPCIDGPFKCMFYWDTFYTNRGLILDGEIEFAKWNVDNLIYMLKKYGYVPNSNSWPGVKHNSQPPYLFFMVKDIYDATHDDLWLKDAYEALKIEYEFWMKERITPLGLNRYYHHKKTDQECIDFYDYVTTRLDIDKNAPKEVKIKQGSAYNACGESGLDFSPRFNIHGDEICPIDLNCILYAMEGYLASLASRFEREKEDFFKSKQKERAMLIYKYLYNEKDGIYYDFNFVKNEFEQTDFYFTAQFWPYIVGLSFDKEGCLKVLKNLEQEYGISATSPYPGNLEYQAGYPYNFPYDTGISFWALTTLDLKQDALRIGDKWLHVCSSSYLKAGHLWEMYDSTIDEIAVKKEYPNAEMMGWTAGVFEWVYDYIEKNER